MTLTDHREIDRRRRTLVAAANPCPSSDYVVKLNGTMMVAGLAEAIKFRIRYVPDSLILDPRSLDHYTQCVRRQEWSSLEEAALALLTDFNNVVVPRWLAIQAETRRSGTDRNAGTDNHHVVVLTDRQPGWDNPDLLSLLD